VFEDNAQFPFYVSIAFNLPQVPVMVVLIYFGAPSSSNPSPQYSHNHIS